VCIRCGLHEAPSGRGYCSTCLPAIRVEVEQGLLDLDRYLRAWAAFDTWCGDHDLPSG
jgi:hypothetical protein